MIKIYDKNLIPQTDLTDSAHNIGYTKKMNDIWQGNFSLPLNSPKVKYCEPYHYARIKDIGLFRITPSSASKVDKIINYDVEHVLATLLDDLMFRYHQFTNQPMRVVLEEILKFQSKQNWILGECDFPDVFSYKFENENLLSALFSVPKVLQEEYIWTWDTTNYPWILNLKKAKTQVDNLIRYKKNLTGLERHIDPTGITTRLYGLGYGEGVNQLTISEINNGLPYLEKNVDKHGVHANLFTDKRFEVAENLKAEMQRILDEVSKLKVTYDVKSVDTYKFTEQPMDKFELGNLVRVINRDDDLDVDVIDRIKEIQVQNIDVSPEYNLTIGNPEEKASDQYTKMLEKQKINDLYSQGATNILNFNYQDNCDSNVPALIPFYIDDDVVNVNTVELTFRTKPFRAYSQATEGGGATATTTASGGGTATTTGGGGGTSKTTNSVDNHKHKMFGKSDYVAVGTVQKRYEASLGNNVSTYIDLATSQSSDLYTLGASGQHSHSFTLSDHTHSLTLAAHIHSLSLPAHIHAIKFGIYQRQDTPSSVIIKVDGNEVNFTSTEGDRINLVEYLSKSGGKITRGRHEIEIFPSGLARIEADVILRVFIQSRLGTTL